MFKKFDPSQVSTSNILKSSLCRAIRTAIVEQFPSSQPHIDLIWPKKAEVVVAKCRTAERSNIFYVDGFPAFFNFRDTKDSPYFPTLRLVHRFPTMLPRMQVDTGAIRFALKGADMMAPGLTSPGGAMDDVERDQVVAVTAEGKQHALAVGLTKQSTAEIVESSSGVAVEVMHYLGDGLYDIEHI
ncbi:hypothetical protein GEMRC1_001957 [Eukaryota sp. GEM-RC1]